MNNIVKYFDTVESSFKKTKLITISALSAAAVISLGSLIYAASYVGSHNDNIYVVDKGEAYSATVSQSDVNRHLECEDHVTRFHELMFNLSPSSDAIKRNLDRALVMSDRSAYEYYSDLNEREFYQRMIRTNAMQQITIDSVRVDMRRYPYQEHTYGKVYYIRESNITAYEFESTGRLVDVGRSKNNPHGLMLEKFAVIRQDKIETRRRN